MHKSFLILFFSFSSLIFSQTTDRYTIKNVNINTTQNEFGTFLSNDGSIYYLKSSFKNQMDLGELSAGLYKGELSLRGEISKGLKFPADAIHAVFTSDGSVVYYSKKDGNNFQLYRANIDNTGRWKNNIKLPFNNPSFNFKQPALTKDNTKLFFVSDKADSYGSTDIYYVNVSNHGLNYSEPVHLGYYVNSPGEEVFPHLGEKDKLYFSSDGMGGSGGLDIFESFYSNGAYEKTANLGDSINSDFDDFAFTLISENHKGFFSSNRQGGKGGVDIYFFEDKKPTLNKCSNSIKGYVKNKENQKPIHEATIEIFDSKGNNETTLTDKDGIFIIDNVECEVAYDIVAYKEGFNGFAEVHTSPKNNDFLNLFLNPEFPEGFKEEFDLTNELVVIDTKSNKEIIPEKNTPTLPQNNKSQEQLNTIAEAKKTAEELKNQAPKKQADDWDPLDYDPKTQPKKPVAQNQTTPKDVESKANNTPKKVVDQYDPLDYDPHSQPKPAKKTKEELDREVAEAQSKKLTAEQEREKMKAEALATANKLKEQQTSNQKEIAQQEIIKKQELEKKVAAQNEAIADAKKRDEQQRIEKENIAATNAQKAKQAEIDKLKAEQDEKARLQVERDAKAYAQRQAAEQEREKMKAEALATANKLKEQQTSNQKEIAQQEIIKKQELEKKVAAQNEAIADAKKRDEQQRIEKENIAATNAQKAKQAEADKLKAEQDEKARLQVERDAKAYAQRQAAEQEREKMKAEALATANKLKEQQISNQKEIAQQEIIKKQELEKNLAAQNEAIADAKKRDEQQRIEKENIAATNAQKAKQAEADKLKAEQDEKARLQAESDAKALAQRQAAEQEREKMKAEALATANKLKEEQTSNQKEIAQQENIKKQELEKNVAAQNEAIADAKKRDEQQRIEKENIAATNAQKAKQAEADKLKAEQDEKARLQAESDAKALAQRQAAEQEREKMKAEALATKLKLEEENKQNELASSNNVINKTNQTDKENTIATSNSQKVDKNQNKENPTNPSIAARFEKAKLSAEKLLKEKTQFEQINQPIISNTSVSKTEDQKQIEGSCAKNINGWIKNSTTNKNIANATIDMYFDGQNIESVKTNEKGEFYFYNVDCNTKYTLICYKEGFDNLSKAVIDTQRNPKDITILLDPNNEKAVAVIDQKKEVVTNPVNKKVDDTAYSGQNKIVYDDEKKENDDMTYNVEEKDIEAPKVEAGKVVINPIYFDLDEWYLTLPARGEFK